MVDFHLSKALVACAAVLTVAMPVLAAERPSCTEVLRELTRAGGHPGSYRPDADKVGRKLGTDGDWVARCAETYGRRVKRNEVAGEKAQLNQTLAEKDEAADLDDLDQEEIDTKDDRYVTVLEDDEETRRRLMRFNADSSAELEPFDTHEWSPHTGYEWAPLLHDDDHPNEE